MYRILIEEYADGRKEYRIEKKVWFGWKPVLFLPDFFDNQLKYCQDWIKSKTLVKTKIVEGYGD